MCQIIPSPILNTSATTTCTKLLQDYDAWFEILNRNMPMEKNEMHPELFSINQGGRQIPSLMEFACPSLLYSGLPICDSDMTLSPMPSSNLFNNPSWKKPSVHINPKSRPTKANNVKRSSPDDPITEEVARKRQKQNEAAKKCRQKRISQLEEYQDRVNLAERDNFDLSVRVAVLEREKCAWIKKEKELVACRYSLKAQLDLSLGMN